MSRKGQVKAAYIAASTNRYPSAADCKGSLVALGSASYVALWNIAVGVHGVTRVLNTTD